MTWNDFIDRPADALDALRRHGRPIVLTRRRGGDVRLCSRFTAGPEVARTVAVCRLEEERRQIGMLLDDGAAVAITRWGVVEGLLWTERAERALAEKKV